uniref:Uncharacterized protein n=1 Tax=Strigamia maritima TaxID=126957 RepID=T1JNH4_STRMM
MATVTGVADDGRVEFHIDCWVCCCARPKEERKEEKRFLCFRESVKDYLYEYDIKVESCLVEDLFHNSEKYEI